MSRLTERPVCSHCLKASSARGIPAEGVICLYSANSIFATEEDIELEEKFGKSERCLWSQEPILALSKKDGDVEMVKEEEREEFSDEERCKFFANSFRSSRRH